MHRAPGAPDPRRIEPLWDRVDKNRRLQAYYVAGFAAFGAVGFGAVVAVLIVVLALVGAMSGTPVLITPLAWMVSEGPLAAMFKLWALGVVASLLYEARALARSERWFCDRLGATLVPKGELLETKMALKDMAIAAGAPVAPALYVIDASGVNAFVFGRHKRRPVLGVTTGMLGKMSIDEQRAVFATLMARVQNNDIGPAAVITALMWPVHAWRDWRLEQTEGNASMETSAATYTFTDGDTVQTLTVNLLDDTGANQSSAEAALTLFVFGFALVMLGEIAAATHRAAQLKVAEKADAEGMLLLKDPRTMLRALEHAIRLDNVVPKAGEAFGQLFYCWTGDSTNDEDDPEWRRVSRLREVLGVEGQYVADEGVPGERFPTAPRFEATWAERSADTEDAGAGL